MGYFTKKVKKIILLLKSDFSMLLRIPTYLITTADTCILGLSPELCQEFRGHLGRYSQLSQGPRKPFHRAASYSTSSYIKKSLLPWFRHAILSKTSWRTQTTSWLKIAPLSTADFYHMKYRCLAGLQSLTVLQVSNL